MIVRNNKSNNSMDAELALWMSNISQIESGSFVFDPFVGSGSLLLTSAHYGHVDKWFSLSSYFPINLFLYS